MKKFLNKKSILIASIILVGITFFSFKGDNRNFRIAKNLDIFNSIYKEVEMFYVDTINPDEVIREGIDAMLMKLDPYTNYFPEEDMSDLKFMTTGKYGGIGSIISYHKTKNRVVINEPYIGMPAAKVGLKAGDMLMELDGKDLKGKAVGEVSTMLKGEVGTSFLLKVERPGEKKPLSFKITREAIQLKSVPYYGMVGKTGYILLTQFTEGCAKEVRNAVIALKKQG
ncbi:MAG: PDZ domain-containing protein, partial [Bacteroidaceae bacterium]